MEKLRDFFEWMTIILFTLFLSGSTSLFICLLTSIDIPLWIDLMVIFLTIITILSATITISLCKNKKNIEIKKEIIYEYCMICKSKLDQPIYPEDFPDKFKICCFCKAVADIVYKEEHNEIFNHIKELHDLLPKGIGVNEYFERSEHYNQHKKEFDDIFIVKNSEVIRKYE